MGERPNVAVVYFTELSCVIESLLVTNFNKVRGKELREWEWEWVQQRIPRLSTDSKNYHYFDLFLGSNVVVYILSARMG
jgi:hypothetical protein